MVSNHTGYPGKRICRLAFLFALLFVSSFGRAQTFKFNSSEASGIRTASQLRAHGLPDTITVWCNEWNTIMASPATWGNNMKLKSNNAFVKFFVDHYYPKSQLPYTYRMTYQIFGYTTPADSTIYTVTNDTLTITNFDHADPKNAFQDIQLTKYSNYYKTKVIITGIYDYNGGSLSAAILSDTLRWNFNVESSIVTQKYDKTNYGSSYSLETSQVPDAANNILNVYFNLPGGSTPVQLRPVNFELEWTYVDDYSRNLTTGSISSLSASSLAYNFTNNSTRVWLDSSHYRIPIVYPNGYIVYRVRMVRPDSVSFRYPIYSQWSYSIADNGNIGSLSSSHPSAVYHIPNAYAHDSLNWQYTISFAEGGKYKHVLSFYDGLLKNRESITRFNSNLNKLIVTRNIYDYEGRPAIKTLPAPTSSSSFKFLHNVDLNSATNLPYRAADFDTGFHICPSDPGLSPLAANALANIYYSNQNPDTAGFQKFVPDAGGYPMVQTMYSPAFNDRVEKQGGAGVRLQIADSNIITNYYVTTGQLVLNRIFGMNVGWNNYYNMTVSRDPNMQLSMSIKNYEGKQVASSLIGDGGNPLDHAINPFTTPSAIYLQEDILQATPQMIIGNKRIADKDFFNEFEGNDSIRYEYKFSPYPVCPGQYLSVKARYDYYVTDQCGDTVHHEDSVLGYTGVVSSPVAFTGQTGMMHLYVGPYSVHKELTINPDDVEAALDSYRVAPPNCLHDEPWFIRRSVESKKFPCPDLDQDPCSIKRTEMIRDLYPGGAFGGYTVGPGGTISANPPSLFYFTEYGYPHHWYQDTCVLSRLPDSITISGITYYNIRTMPVDSFIYVYNLSIAAGNNAIANALLPLHPEYCALKACIVDTFKTLLLALPNAQVAEQRHLLYLDSIIAHDPLVGILSGYSSIADSLATYPGGQVRLDYMELIKVYCGCSDSVMLKECVSHIFDYEINNKVLTNDIVKEAYFQDMINVYLQNRQRFLNSYIVSSTNDSCLQCASTRFPRKDSIHGVFPGWTTSTGAPSPFMHSGSWGGGMGSWLLAAMDSIGAPLSPSALAAYGSSAAIIWSTGDSTICFGGIDSMVARLFNCGNGDTAVLNGIHNTFDSLCAAHVIRSGRYTPEIIRFVLTRNGVSIDDLCNPYLVSFGMSAPTSPGSQSCMPDMFYTDTKDYFNKAAVLTPLMHPGGYYHDTLNPLTNQFEQYLATVIGANPVVTQSTYDAANSLNTLYIFKEPSLGLSDTVKIYFRGTGGCANVFGATADSIRVRRVACINEVSASFVSGYINRLSFVATVDKYAPAGMATCALLGWTDTVETMTGGSSALKGCVPCTEMRRLYSAFADTMASLGMVGSDHPLYDKMLLHFMNYYLAQSYTIDQYQDFITSCGLADSMFMRQYVGYANYVFANVADANAFIGVLNGIDPAVNFDDIYRDSSAAGITVCVDMNLPPHWELYKYRDALNAYSVTPTSYNVNAALQNMPIQGDTVVGFFYAYPGSVIPPATTIFGSGTTIHFSAPETRGIWMGTHYEPQDVYRMIRTIGATMPYEISRSVYELRRYFFNHGIGATLVSNYQTTANKDYFKPQKTDYLRYTYRYQSLPPYEVLDSVQEGYLKSRIASYSNSEVSYNHPFDPNVITNLYMSDSSMVNHYFDTLVHILQTVADSNLVNPGFTFFDTNKVVVLSTPDSPLIAYRCSDGTYWYRYFGHGDTLYNVYVAMPKWIPRSQRKFYKIISVAPPPGIAPALGDSISRTFVLNLRRAGDPTVVQAKGLTTFVIGRNTELRNVLLGNPLTSTAAVPAADTFNHCERQLLNDAIREGIVNYRNYIDSVMASIRAGFTAYMLNNVEEKLIVGYQIQQFGYTLYNYDRAGNLTSTVPPEGVAFLGTTSLGPVDAARAGNVVPPPLIPAHTKVSSYRYNTVNQVVDQTTPDGGNTRFFYDKAGRLLLSQNEKQAPDGYCTYNLYDRQNRIFETGEAKLMCPYFEEFEADIMPPGYMPTCAFSYPPHNPMLSARLYSPYSPIIRRLYEMPHDSIILYIRSVDRRDVVLTVYDTMATNLQVIANAGLDLQENLRKRVAAVKYFDFHSARDTFDQRYTYANHYSYDIAGNVKTLVHDFPALGYLQQRYKRVDYDYDMISGKVNLLSYNRSFADQYYQRYAYDDDNRIKMVETSADGIIWHKDAEYSYYQHGPLARVDVGNQQVQGIDYAYTVQGWLKTMNGDTLNRAMDMGRDADVTMNAQDAAYYSIDYFNQDYKPITSFQMSHVAPLTRSLYNGNISRQTMAMGDFKRLSKQYAYDQMNRINNAAYSAVSAIDHSLTGLPDYRNKYSYDLDGNLKTLTRYGNNTGGGAQIMDSLFYYYGAGIGGYSANQLKTLTDLAPNVYTNDIRYNTLTTPVVNHYMYDKVGNTIKDKTSGQDTIRWNLYNRVTETRNSAGRNWMNFTYDGAGNRVAKRYSATTDTGSIENNTFYVHDAQGNILAIYRENSIYKISVVAYVLECADAHLAAGGTLGMYIYGFVAPEFGMEAEFQSAVMAKSLADNAFLEAMLDKPVSVFMQDRSLFSDMVQSNTDYFNALLDYDVTNGDSIVSRALLACPPSDLKPLLVNLFSDGEAAMRALHVLCTSGGDSLMNHLAGNEMQMMFDECDQARQKVVFQLEQGANSPANVGNFTDNVLSAGTHHPDQFAQFLRYLAYSPDIYSVQGFSGPQSQYLSSFTKILANWAKKSAVGAFFDQYANAESMIDAIADDERLMRILYNQDMGGYLWGFDSAFGRESIDTAIAEVSAIEPPYPYAMRMIRRTGVILPVYHWPESTIDTTLVSHNFDLAEHDIYGSARLGVKNYWPGQKGLTWNYAGRTFDTVTYRARQPWYSCEYQDVIKDTARNLYGNTHTAKFTTQHLTGQKQYELTDHLGDVLATVSDARQPNDTTSGHTIAWYKPVVKTAYDYYPFGMYMPGRYMEDTASHCTTVSSTTLIPSTTSTWVPWTIWTGPVVSLGGGTVSSAGNEGVVLSTGAWGDGMTYHLSVEPGVPISFDLSVTSASIDYTMFLVEGETILGTRRIRAGGPGIYGLEATPELSGIDVVVLPWGGYVDDGGYIGTASFGGHWVTTTTYTPHTTVSTICSDDEYRYGYNGMYKDNEWAGVGNSYEYGVRMFDSRVGRFRSVDPLTIKYPWYTPYQFAGNTPIFSIDRDGLENEWYIRLARYANKALISSANSITLTATGIIMPIINQTNVILHEGPHEGGAYYTKNLDWAVPYTINDNWTVQKHKELMTPETLSWESGKLVMNNLTDVLTSQVPIKPYLFPKGLIQKGINYGTDNFVKKVVGKAVEKALDAGDNVGKSNPGGSGGGSGGGGGGGGTEKEENKENKEGKGNSSEKGSKTSGSTKSVVMHGNGNNTTVTQNDDGTTTTTESGSGTTTTSAPAATPAK